jgi:UPF0755 protein
LPIPVFLAAIGLFLIVLAGLGFYLTSPTGVGPFTLEVKRGTTLPDAVKQLQSRGVIRSADVFRLVLRVTGADRSLKDGFYDVSGRMDYFELARTFERTPRSREVRITIPEGFILKNIASRFSAAGWSNPDQLQKAFATSALSGFVPQGKSLEGFLFPATYKFVPEATATEIARVLTKRFEQEVTPERKKTLEKMGLSVYQWVTLASVVQAEAGNAKEMPVIAGVFLNRLKIGMALQSDPIIAYGLGKRLPELDRRGGDFEKDTPYNSYKNVGLPPTPINSPGAAALEAVLSAQRTAPNGDGWLYFLHGRDGLFKPNTNFQAHLRDTNRYR